CYFIPTGDPILPFTTRGWPRPRGPEISGHSGPGPFGPSGNLPPGSSATRLSLPGRAGCPALAWAPSRSQAVPARRCEGGWDDHLGTPFGPSARLQPRPQLGQNARAGARRFPQFRPTCLPQISGVVLLRIII